ncbi:MAG: YceI family protein [Candidatus Nanopelagicales bacterium]
MSDLTTTTGTWVIDPSHTTLGFQARHAMIAKVRGRFSEFEGSFVLDGASPDKSTARLTIQAASIDTRTPDRDAHLKSPDFLDADAFPTLDFVSTGVKQTGDTSFVVTGDLTIRGTTRSVDIDFELLGVNPDPWGGTRIGFEGSTEISRKDFGLTWNVAIEGGGVLVGDKVKIELDVEAVLQA